MQKAAAVAAATIMVIGRPTRECALLTTTTSDNKNSFRLQERARSGTRPLCDTLHLKNPARNAGLTPTPTRIVATASSR